MICPVWLQLQARFVRAAKAIERNGERVDAESEQNLQLNAVARAAAQELSRHEREHGCKPSREEIAAEGLRRWEQASRRVTARQKGNKKGD